MNDAMKNELTIIENELLELIPDPLNNPSWYKRFAFPDNIENLLERRCVILNNLFKAHLSSEDVTRFEHVNRRLYDLTEKMYKRMAGMYRTLLSMPKDQDFDDDIVIEANLRFICEEEDDVLRLDDDDYYGSRFLEMNAILSVFNDNLVKTPIAWEVVPYNPRHVESMSDTELGVVNDLDDGESWNDAPLNIDAFKDIVICNAAHVICDHMHFSIPDMLRMNDFWIDIQSTVQHITTLDGKHLGRLIVP